MPRIVDLARDLVGRFLAEGDLAVDATVGNGRDTLWLADRVGPRGRVIGLDVQADALLAARGPLVAAGLAGRVLLVRAGHEALGTLLRPLARPRAIVFNLGHRPGGDRTIATRADTTIPALDAALDLLDGGGLLSVVVYPGHAGGRAESEAVLAWASNQARHRAEVIRVEPMHTLSAAPWLLALAPRRARRD